MSKVTAPLWTTEFINHNYEVCRYVEYGQSDGQPISLKTVKLLSDRYLKKNGRRHKIDRVLWIKPGAHVTSGPQPSFYYFDPDGRAYTSRKY